MKNFVVVLIAFFTITFSFGQNAVFKGSAEDIKSGRESGKFEFILPEGAEKEEVMKHAGYYTDYFEVEYNEKTRVAVVTLEDNEEMNRLVINRFLLTNGARHVEVDGKEYALSDFFETFMK